MHAGITFFHRVVRVVITLRAVELGNFLHLFIRQGKIKFLDIGELVSGAVDNVENFTPKTVDDVLKADALARKYVTDRV